MTRFFSARKRVDLSPVLAGAAARNASMGSILKGTGVFHEDIINVCWRCGVLWRNTMPHTTCCRVQPRKAKGRHRD